MLSDLIALQGLLAVSYFHVRSPGRLFLREPQLWPLKPFHSITALSLAFQPPRVLFQCAVAPLSLSGAVQDATSPLPPFLLTVFPFPTV